jgi:AraC-like DNA-binding protein
MITHLSHAPANPVGRFVAELWLVRGRLPQTTRQALLPDGAVVLMFNLGAPQRLCDRRAPHRHTSFQASWISGQQPQPIVLERAGLCHLVGIRFRAGGALPLFGFSIAELTGRVVELEAIWGHEASALREQLAEAPTDRALLACLERQLATQLRAAPAPNPRIVHAAHRLQEGGTGVARIAGEIGWSHKHLIQEFTRAVGLTPKHYGGVQRLQRALRLIGHAREVNWSDVAVAAGYYDQAHLANELRAHTGYSGSELLRRRTPYVGYLDVD